MDPFADLLTHFPHLALYLSLFIGPFIQEDTAVMAGASLSVTHPQYLPAAFILLNLGLFCSDIWKYWIGWAARQHKSSDTFSQEARVLALEDKVQNHIAPTLFLARFIPFTRIPTYIACGYFKIKYTKFCALIALTALLYTSLIFMGTHLLGQALGQRAEWMLPIICIGGVVTLLTLMLLKRILNRAKPK